MKIKPSSYNEIKSDIIIGRLNKLFHDNQTGVAKILMYLIKKSSTKKTSSLK